MRAAPR